MSRVPTLVAREQELAELLAAIRDASEGNGGLVLIAGEAGVGKTRLTHEAAKASGAIVLGGGASPDGSPAYGPVVDALRAGLRLDASREFHPSLALLMPELGPPPTDAAPATILEALRQGFESIAERAPVIVVLDDLQWADETTLVDVCCRCSPRRSRACRCSWSASTAVTTCLGVTPCAGSAAT